jgi:Protein of unknown function (DUF1552)
MIITKKALSRRTFIRGIGATLALPFLDAMVPALSGGTAAVPVQRLGFIYIPMGANIAKWTPPGEGKLVELSPILDSMTPFRKLMTVVTNLELKNAYAKADGNHATANCTFMSCVRAKPTESSDYFLGTTVDQVAAQKIGRSTPLPSLELSMDLIAQVGNCDNGYACAYQNDLSWSSPTTPLPAEADPRVVFERLFGDGGSIADRKAELRKNHSILDSVTEDLARLQRQVGAADSASIDQYLNSVREVERRIQQAEQKIADSPLPDLERPATVPAEWEDHVKLMFDLQVLALQADITRVITFQLAREASTRTYPQIGVPEAHHPVSHHQEEPEKLAKLAKINAYHVSLISYFVNKLHATQDGDGSLLDHSLYMVGSGMGNPSSHDHSNLPAFVVGGGAGKHKGEQHIKYLEPTPLANLYLTLLHRMGVEADTFGDSTGTIEQL